MLLAFDVGEIRAVLRLLAEQSFKVDLGALNGAATV